MDDQQQHWMEERRWNGRCPYCGGRAIAVFRYGDDIDSGSMCYISCGWMDVYGETEKEGNAYIAPGDEGSHDTKEDYDE